MLVAWLTHSTIKPPFVAESAFSMECELAHSHDIVSEDGSVVYTMVLGRVKKIHAVSARTQRDTSDRPLQERSEHATRLTVQCHIGTVQVASNSTGDSLGRRLQAWVCGPLGVSLTATEGVYL